MGGFYSIPSCLVVRSIKVNVNNTISGKIRNASAHARIDSRQHRFKRRKDKSDPAESDQITREFADREKNRRNSLTQRQIRVPASRQHGAREEGERRKERTEAKSKFTISDIPAEATGNPAASHLANQRSA